MKTIDTIIQSKNCIDNKNKHDNFIENTKNPYTTRYGRVVKPVIH